VYEHYTLEDDRSSTMMTIGVESLLVSLRLQLFVTVPFGADGQIPVSLAFRLPIPTQHVTSQVCPPLRARLLHRSSSRIECCWVPCQRAYAGTQPLCA
jgi:hypothetical protein